MSISRRNFLAGAGVASAAAAAVLAGCSKGTATQPSAESAASGDTAGNGTAGTQDSLAAQVSETIDADIVVVGGGMSGLAAAVQAGCNGDSVVLLEAGGALGGAGNGVEGIFGVNSPLQKELGITLNPAEVLSDETASTNYTNSGLHWRDTIVNSGNNIAWLLEQGAEFSGVVDGYTAGGRFETFHWWKDGHAKDGYVPQMSARAQELGVNVLTLTRAQELIFEDGTVKGLFAKDADDAVIQVNAKAVILAAGGFVGNQELLARQMFITEGEMAQACLDTAAALNRMGDGVNMALAVGAKAYPGTCIEGWYQPKGAPVGDASMTFTAMVTDKLSFRESYLYSGLGGGAITIWVQEEGQRFVNESQSLTEIERTFSTRKFYKKHFQIYDQTVMDALFATDDLKAAHAAMVDQYEGMFQADSIQELAGMLGLDAAALQATVDEYNGYCAAGVDEAFGKPADFLVPIAQAPFYGFECVICGDATLGGICVDRGFRALDVNKSAIPGLYMAGVDSCMLYNCVYPIGVPGTACCNSVNSGRTAANSAHADIQG